MRHTCVTLVHLTDSSILFHFNILDRVILPDLLGLVINKKLTHEELLKSSYRLEFLLGNYVAFTIIFFVPSIISISKNIKLIVIVIIKEMIKIEIYYHST